MASGEVKFVTKPKIKSALYPCRCYAALAVRRVLCIVFYCLSHLARRCNRLHTTTYTRNYGRLPYSRRIYLSVRTRPTMKLWNFSLQQRSLWEDYGSPPGEVSPCLVWNPKVSETEQMPCAEIVSQLIPDHTSIKLVAVNILTLSVMSVCMDNQPYSEC